ncbi:MAG: ankyrin repeat domain-containing protein, partial [Akkermansia sp.]|nr:ankyrin repeat domain-containing protein [Akkermansia sp.]
GSTEFIKLLLASGADVNCANTNGETPLHRAAEWERTECVRLLLTTPGIDVNKSDQSGRTPLNVARSPKCAQLIRAAGGK